jgi:predicted DCC family thiol-disulfide oxidoreductase YuxK
LRHDRHEVLRFAALQSAIATPILARHDGPYDLSTMALVENPGRSDERLVIRSQGALEILAALGGVWRFVSWLRIVPRPLRDIVYRWVSRNRYRWFGRSDRCELPAPEHLARFIDQPVQSSERSQALASESSVPSK